jgi:hypothetical protein
MTEGEYRRLNATLKAVAEKQKTFADSSLEAEKRFAITEQAIADLLKEIKNRRRNN